MLLQRVLNPNELAPAKRLHTIFVRTMTTNAFSLNFMDFNSFANTSSIYQEKIDGRSIRLLRISRLEDGSFSGRLKAFPLADAPPFYSASYTWGEKVFSDTPIRLNTGMLPVLKGLAPFLNMVSQHEDFDDEDWWWIDSLSINLADGKEREQQVHIMADIYRRAQRAMVWLGDEVEEGNDCRGAIDFLRYLSDLQPAFRGHESQITRSTLRSPLFNPHWTAVGNLLGRSWWTRVWTLQEMILPQQVKLYCGQDSISRGRFKSAMYSIFLCSVDNYDITHDLIPRKVFDAAFNRRRIHQWHTSNNPKPCGMPLVAILAYLGNHLASDSRDRIFSVLGLITERDRRLVGAPEYASSIPHLYSKLVRSFYKEYRNLDIICFSHLFNRYSNQIDTGRESAVPSWTPDWRAHTEFASPVPLMASQSASEHIGNFRPLRSHKWKAVYDAPGQRLRNRADIRFHANLKELWCNGIILDTIDALGALENCDPRCRSFICSGEERVHGLLQQPQSADMPPSPNHSSRKLLRAITFSLVLNRQDKYLRFEAPDYYITEFLALCRACLERRPTTFTDPTFSSWFYHNQNLRIGTQTFASLITSFLSSKDPTATPLLLSSAAPSPSVYPPNTNAESDSDDADTFLSRFQDTVRKKSRRLMVTREGHVGMAPCRARPGDTVAVLFGCSIPLVLRRVGMREAWQVIGEAYVHDFMNGEVEKLIAGGSRGKAKGVHRFRLV